MSGAQIDISVLVTRFKTRIWMLAAVSTVSVALLAAYHILFVPVVSGPEFAPWRLYNDVFLSFNANTAPVLTADELVAFYSSTEFSVSEGVVYQSTAEIVASEVEAVHALDVVVMFAGMGLTAFLTR